jgi:hypothetical protein
MLVPDYNWFSACGEEMIKGNAIDRIDRRAWEIAVYDDEQRVVYTFELTRHQIDPNSARYAPIQTTLVDYLDKDVMRGIAEAFRKMGIMDDSATTAELKATKYHLEDMRKLALTTGSEPVEK